VTFQVLLPSPTAPRGEPRRRISVSFRQRTSSKGSSQVFWSCPACLPQPFLSSSGREGNSVTVVEQRQSRLFDGGRVPVLGAALGGDGAKAFGAVEKLNCSGESHDKPFDVTWQELMNGPTHSPDDSGSGKRSAGDGIHLTKK
jgi:hypothetical protein